MAEDKKVAEKKAADKVIADKKIAEKVAKDAADKENASKEKADAEKKTSDFGTEEFYVEDPKFYETLEKKISNKENIGDFVFDDAKRNPNRVAIRILPNDAVAPGSRIRGKIKCKKGDFLLRDTTGNRLRVTPKVFREVYNKVIG